MKAHPGYIKPSTGRSEHLDSTSFTRSMEGKEELIAKAEKWVRHGTFDLSWGQVG